MESGERGVKSRVIPRGCVGSLSHLNHMICDLYPCMDRLEISLNEVRLEAFVLVDCRHVCHACWLYKFTFALTPVPGDCDMNAIGFSRAWLDILRHGFVVFGGGQQCVPLLLFI